MSNDFDKYLAIANHDIQMAIDDVQLKSYVASILYDNDKKVNMLNEKDKEIERLNNIIKKLERLVDDYAWNSYYIKCGNRYLKSEILNDIREIIELKGSDKE